ncbi:protein of unknown function (plasmid) [Cupriavidus taiwanensis]|uniref:Uncharacterized protein n=1 Tax=Cupriavidus taiwanensis TaxID=164546 RepID=A0A375IR01_9BURK|nr:protein of unknown function [Cupriavidus taiwanensis]
MPALASHQPRNVCLVIDRVPRVLALMPAGVAQPAGGHDVAFEVTASINSRVEMLGRTLQGVSLALGEVVGRGECFRGSRRIDVPPEHREIACHHSPRAVALGVETGQQLSSGVEGDRRAPGG